MMHDFRTIIMQHRFWALRVVYGVNCESCKIVFLGVTSYSLVQTLL